MVNKEALDTLQNYGIHPSVQRIAIMDYLLKIIRTPQWMRCMWLCVK